MIPELTATDYLVLLISLPCALIPLLPCVGAVIVIAIKKRAMHDKIKFALLSGVIAYGITALAVGAIVAPLSIINTFLTPQWLHRGYEDFANIFQATEWFTTDVFGLGVLAIASFVAPVKLLNRWQPTTEPEK